MMNESYYDNAYYGSARPPKNQPYQTMNDDFEGTTIYREEVIDQPPSGMPAGRQTTEVIEEVQETNRLKRFRTRHAALFTGFSIFTVLLILGVLLLGPFALTLLPLVFIFFWPGFWGDSPSSSTSTRTTRTTMVY
jgi:hypothetical protein